MKEIKLFKSKSGQWVTNLDIVKALEAVDAGKCKILYMHSELSFGQPNPELKKTEILSAIYEAIRTLGVQTMMVPTFTFSFCNGEDFDVQKSKSQMGAFNEYFRKLPEAIRSIDPLMSSALIGEEKVLVTNIGRSSIGNGSTFAQLHERGRDVRFLFLGASLSACFTYMHYVEENEKCFYRYDRDFTGKLTSNGRTWEDTYSLFVRYKGVLADDSGRYEEFLMENGFMKRTAIGDSTISCIAEPIAYETHSGKMKEDPSWFLKRPVPKELIKEFSAHNMVAL